MGTTSRRTWLACRHSNRRWSRRGATSGRQRGDRRHSRRLWQVWGRLSDQVSRSSLSLTICVRWHLLTQPWLLIALVIYAANLLVAGFISRPNLRRLIGLRSDAGAWERRARQQRWIAYGMGAATGVIGFLMMTKPGA